MIQCMGGPSCPAPVCSRHRARATPRQADVMKSRSPLKWWRRGKFDYWLWAIRQVRLICTPGPGLGLVDCKRSYRSGFKDQNPRIRCRSRRRSSSVVRTGQNGRPGAYPDSLTERSPVTVRGTNGCSMDYLCSTSSDCPCACHSDSCQSPLLRS